MSSSSKKSIYAALFGNFLIAVTKFIAAAVTSSSAMLSEGIHSVVDTGNQILLLFGIKQSKKAASDLYPYGHGKEIYFWSFVVAIMIFAVGAGISMYEGIIHIITPVQIEDPLINYIVIGLALIFEGISWSIAFKHFKELQGNKSFFEAVHSGKDPTIIVVLFEDSAAMLGLIAALIGVFLGHYLENPYFDGAASIVIGLILGGTAAWLAYETKGLLIGESAGTEKIIGIRGIISSFNEVENINEILTMHMGPEFILVNISLDFKSSISSDDIEITISKIDTQIKEKFPLVKKIFIELESTKRLKRQ